MRSDIIERVRKAVGKTAQKAVKVSNDAIDYTKLKFKLFEIQDKLEAKYAEIGRLVYEGDRIGDVDEICADITDLKEEEEEIKLKITSYQGKKTCDSCGNKVDSECEYCPVCGSKFE